MAEPEPSSFVWSSVDDGDEVDDDDESEWANRSYTARDETPSVHDWSGQQMLTQSDPWDTDEWFPSLQNTDLWQGLSQVDNKLRQASARSSINYAEHHSALYNVIQYIVWHRISRVPSPGINKAKITGLSARGNVLTFQPPDSSNQDISALNNALENWDRLFQVDRANTDTGVSVVRAAEFSVVRPTSSLRLTINPGQRNAVVDCEKLFFTDIGGERPDIVVALARLANTYNIRLPDRTIAENARTLAADQRLGWMPVILAGRFFLSAVEAANTNSFNQSPGDPLNFMELAQPQNLIQCDLANGTEIIKFKGTVRVPSLAMTFLSWPHGVRLKVGLDPETDLFSYVLVLGLGEDAPSSLKRIAERFKLMYDPHKNYVEPWVSRPIPTMALTFGRTWSQLPTLTLAFGRSDPRLVTSGEDPLTQQIERNHRNAVKLLWRQRVALEEEIRVDAERRLTGLAFVSVDGTLAVTDTGVARGSGRGRRATNVAVVTVPSRGRGRPKRSQPEPDTGSNPPARQQRRTKE